MNTHVTCIFFFRSTATKVCYHATVSHVLGIVTSKDLLDLNKQSANQIAKMSPEFILLDVRVSKCSVPFKLRHHANGKLGRNPPAKNPQPLPHLLPLPQLRPLQPPLQLPPKNRLNHQSLSQEIAEGHQEKFNSFCSCKICVRVFD